MTATTTQTLLIVDDSRVSRMMIRTLMQTHRPAWHLFEAGSGDAALALAEQHQPDYCTMDINMPGMLGTEAAEQLQRRFPSLRLVLFSANVQESHQNRAQELGVRFMAKPVSEKTVLRALQYFEDGQ